MHVQQTVRISYATMLTIARMILAPCVFVAVLFDTPLLAVTFFLIAAVTDFFDGFLARSYGQATPLGAQLDPVADKVLVLMSLAALVMQVNRMVVPTYVMYFLCVRELFLLLGAWYVYQRCGQALRIAPTLLGKCTTALQMVCITWALLSITISGTMPWFYYTVLDVMVLCSAGALIQYGAIGYQQLEEYHV